MAQNRIQRVGVVLKYCVQLCSGVLLNWVSWALFVLCPVNEDSLFLMNGALKEDAIFQDNVFRLFGGITSRPSLCPYLFKW